MTRTRDDRGGNLGNAARAIGSAARAVLGHRRLPTKRRHGVITAEAAQFDRFTLASTRTIFDRLDGPRCGTLAHVAARAEARMHRDGHEVRSTMVAGEVRRLATTLMPGASDVLVAAAWLMDIGHVERVKDTGFAALDAARFVRREGFPSIVAELIAHHTATEQEAAERGLADDLAEFPRPPQHWSDMLTYANLCVGLRGEIRTPCTGIANLLADTGQPAPTRRALNVAAPSLFGAAAAVEEELARCLDPLAPG